MENKNKGKGRGRARGDTFNVRTWTELKDRFETVIEELNKAGLRAPGGGTLKFTDYVNGLMCWIVEGPDLKTRAGRTIELNRAFMAWNEKRQPVIDALDSEPKGSNGVGPVIGHHTIGRVGTPEEVADRVNHRTAGRPDGDQMGAKSKRAPKGSVN